MKKTRWILLTIVLAVSAALAGDIGVRVVGRGYRLPLNKTFTLTTNAASLVYENWDAPRKTAGGHYELSAYLRDDSVVFFEDSLSVNGGPVNRTTTTNILKTNAIPQTLTFGQLTVTVFRVEAKIGK